jgi:hypothetical protein
VRAVPVHQWIDDIFDDIEDIETDVTNLTAADTGHFGGTDAADHPEATTSVRGFMSAADKTKLDGFTAGTGVTGGNAHDHVGGDGAQIDHAGLTNLATGDPHTQYPLQTEFDDHSARHATTGADHLGAEFTGYIKLGFASDVNGGSVPGGGASVVVVTTSFVPPASWGTYEMTAWGATSMNAIKASGGADLGFEVQCGIGGVYTDIEHEYQDGSTSNTISGSAGTYRIGLSGTNAVALRIQPSADAGENLSVYGSWVSYIAIRTT